MRESDNETPQQKLWFIRHNNQVKGPYPCGSVRRFVLLGRVGMQDQVSHDRKNWRLVAEVPDVVPPEVRKALIEGDVEQLICSRMREDERDGRERRIGSEDAEYRTRRKGERRQAELEILQKHREAKTDLLARREKKPLPLLGMGVVGALVILVIGFGLYLGAPESIPDPDCLARPGPGVNWRNCNLDGLLLDAVEMEGALLNNSQIRGGKLSGSKFNDSDMQYVDLSGSDLSYTELKRVALKGATLRNADLSYADLTGTDLSFVDLTGANLGGARLHQARLDNAIWVTGARCLAGSIGGCKVPK